MGLLYTIILTVLKKIGDAFLACLPPILREQTEGILQKLKKPFKFLGEVQKEKQEQKGIKAIIKKLLKLIKKYFVKIIKVIVKVIVSFWDVILVIIGVVLVGMIIAALLGIFGPFNGDIVVNFEKFEELNSDQELYEDAQNTSELAKAYMKLVSESSYYQMFNVRDYNPATQNQFRDDIQRALGSFGDLLNNAYKTFRNIIGLGNMDDRYIYTDANKNALKHMKLPKVIGINVTKDDINSNLSEIDDFYRDYYNREKTFMLSDELLTELNRILFGEFSNAESITYPEAFAKPVAFVNDFYRIQEDGLPENVGQPYVYTTQRVTLYDIENLSSEYYNKPWLEGIIKSEPSHIVYDYAIEQKNVPYWADVGNELAEQISWGNTGKYATETITQLIPDGTEVEQEHAVKLYWKVKDSDTSSSVAKLSNGNNPFNEHMGTTIDESNYETFFDGPYTEISVTSTGVKLSNKICEGTSDIEVLDNGVKIRCSYNKYPMRHLQLVSVYDENDGIQLNSRVLFNKTFVQKKTVRDAYRYYPEYFSGFQEFIEADKERQWCSQTSTGEDGYFTDIQKPYAEQKCSALRTFTGSNGFAAVWAKFKEWGQAISNLFTGEEKQAEIGVSSQAMFYVLLAYDNYIIETGEYGVAWDYKYYTSTSLDMSLQAQKYMDVYGFNELFIDSWNDERVYKQTLDSVKALDSKRSVSTTYTPTAIISGQSSATGQNNQNINNTGYGWKVETIANSYGSQRLERVKGEASLELPQYTSISGGASTFSQLWNSWAYNGVYYGPSDFRYYYDNRGELQEKPSVDVFEEIAKDSDSDETIEDTGVSLSEALKWSIEGGDWRNTEEAWDTMANVYRPTNSLTIKDNITSGISFSSKAGRVAYRTGGGEYLPFEVKSVRDYGLGSVLSYIQDIRVVYQTGVFMDEVYSKSGFNSAFSKVENASDFPKADQGYYPKEMLDEYPEILEEMRTTPVTLEQLRKFAANIVSLQYAATQSEEDAAMKAAGSNASSNEIRKELLKIIAKRNVDGIYIYDVIDTKNIQGFSFSTSPNSGSTSTAGTNVCTNCLLKCKIKDEDKTEEEKLKENAYDYSCLTTCEKNGGYFNSGLYDCNERCESDYFVSYTELENEKAAYELRNDTMDEEEITERTNAMTEKRSNCLNACKTSWPSEDNKCTSLSFSNEQLESIYAYSPFLKPGNLSGLSSFWNWLTTGDGHLYNQVQYLDPIQYYISWFDSFSKDMDGNFIHKFLSWLNNDNLVSEIDSTASSLLREIETDNKKGFNGISVEHGWFQEGFGTAGKYVVGKFREDFYNKYNEAIKKINLIVPNESYRVYMIDEAVSFLGTFTYTYKTDIVNIGSITDKKQITALAFADRYYYLSNYIFNIPKIEYKVQYRDGGSKSKTYDEKNGKYPDCGTYSISDAQSDYSGNIFSSIYRFFTGDRAPRILDAKRICKYEITKEWDPLENCTFTLEDGIQCDGGWDYVYTTYKRNYASVETELPASEGAFIDTPKKIEELLSKSSSDSARKTLQEEIYIGMKVYDSLADWSWSLGTNNSTDISDIFKHDYSETDIAINYNGLNEFYNGDKVLHYQSLEDFLSGTGITERKGYLVKDESYLEIDDATGLPNDLYMEIDYDGGLKKPDKLQQSTLEKVYNNAIKMDDYETVEKNVPIGGGGWETKKIKTKTQLQDNIEDMGVGIFMANREDFGYPIPIYRQYVGLTREILPRQRGYYFNGEVFDSWNSRLILTDDTTVAQKQEIFNEKNKIQSYLYDYIMNFETYVPLDVKSDYDLLLRARDAYHNILSNDVSHVQATTELSGSIYNEIDESKAWDEVFDVYKNKLDATDMAQLVSGIIEVTIKRAPYRMVSLLNRDIKEANGTVTIEESSENYEVIENAIKETLDGTASISELYVSLKMTSGGFQTFRLLELGPGMLYYDYGASGNGTLKTTMYSDTSCSGDKCFKDVTLTINESQDDRLDKENALRYVSTKFGRLVKEFGDVKHAIVAYFHGSSYTRAMIAKADAMGIGNNWMSSDDTSMIAEVLNEILGDDGITRTAENIDAFMYTGTVVVDVAAYVQDSGARTVINNGSVTPSSVTPTSGSSSSQAQTNYNKWKDLFDEYTVKYNVDLALAVAVVSQESSANSFSGVCADDGVIHYGLTNKTRACDRIILRDPDYSWKYNGGGGLGQIHDICDGKNPVYSLEKYSNAGPCVRTIKYNGDGPGKGTTITLNMVNPYLWNGGVTTSNFEAFLAADDRYGNPEKSLEASIALLGQLLHDYDGDAYKAIVAYNAGPGGLSNYIKNGGGDWIKYYYSSISDDRNNYIIQVMKFYDKTLQTMELGFGTTPSTWGYKGSSLTINSGDLSFQREQFLIQNSGVELYVPRLTTSRNDVTTLILNISNFGEDEYYLYANEHNLLSFFNDADSYQRDDGVGNTGWIGANAMIETMGQKSNRYVPDTYKFAYIPPIIPMNSPSGKDISEWPVTSPFGTRYDINEGVESTTQTEVHGGVDFGIVQGTSIYSVAPGRVTYAAVRGTYGNLVEISHNIPENVIITDSDGKQYQVVGVYTRYAHLSNIYVTLGEVIAEDCSKLSTPGKCKNLGQAIAASGNTGNSTGPHLHFEVYVTVKDLATGKILTGSQNEKCDPYYWLTTRWKAGSADSSRGLSAEEKDNIMDTIKANNPGLGYNRQMLIRNALELVGKVKYFWSGGHEAVPYVGLNSDWLDSSYETDYPASDSPDGKFKADQEYRLGLDSSGMVAWVAHNTFKDNRFKGGDISEIKSICEAEAGGIVTKENLQPGDFGITASGDDIGIYLYTDDSGNQIWLTATNASWDGYIGYGYSNGFTKYFKHPRLEEKK